jgi:hypothetical protein
MESSSSRAQIALELNSIKPAIDLWEAIWVWIETSSYKTLTGESYSSEE